MSLYELLQGDCAQVLAGLPAGSVHCAVTSPPYLGQRDYGMPGQIGLEGLDEYIDRLVAVFAELWRVLRDDGTLWLNLGDKYNGSGGAGGDYGPGGRKEGQPKYPGLRVAGLKRKDLIGVPWRVAFALQAAGWYLRQHVTWCKLTINPDSAPDRPASATEDLFLLAKSERYFYDQVAVRLPPADDSPNGRPPFNYWLIGPSNYAEAHFATYPPDLVRPCILASTSAGGVCPACGAPYVRIVEKKFVPQPGVKSAEAIIKHGAGQKTAAAGDYGRAGSRRGAVVYDSRGWRPGCACEAGDPVPAVVLDPFNGSGTTGEVAVSLGRRYIGIDLNPSYLELAHKRIGAVTIPLFGL